MNKNIINKPYPDKETEKDFPSPVNRAAQFAPFAALTGFEEQVVEAARLTQRKITPDEGEKEAINRRILFASENISKELKVNITYFVPDEHKAGGKYITDCITPCEIREFEKEIVSSDGRVIPIESIISLDIEGFEI